MFAGIDLGTSGCRAIVIDKSGMVMGQAATTLPEPQRDGPAISQAPHYWWQAVREVIAELSQQVDLSQLQALSVDGTSATLVLTDKLGNPITDALMYNDARARDFVEPIRQHAPPDSAVHSASSSLAKLLWCQQQGLLDKAHYILHQCDWILGRLAGRFGISDVNNCLKLGYDPQQNTWPDWLQHFSVPQDKLPQVRRPGTVIGNVDTDIARELNLPASMQICAGTTDSTAAVLATGINTVGDAVTSLGSTLVLKVLSNAPVFSAHHGVYSQPLFEHWLVGGASNSGGAVLRHYFRQDQLTAMTPKLQPEKPTGFDYYPLITKGERFPINDSSLTPRLAPRPDDDVKFFQGILEGIAAIEQRGYRLLNELGAPYPTRVVTIGGGAANPGWQQIREQHLRVPVEKAAQQQAAYGTALLAMKGAKTGYENHMHKESS
jgi:sugar (pentulose or hexulose) kinase